MRIKFLTAITLMSAVLSGCAIGPLYTHETARTLGDGNHELSAAYGLAEYAFKWNYGLTDNLDIGLQLEAFSLGARIKYAFVNRREKGLSFSTAFGAGVNFGGNHLYFDLMASYLKSSFEPYFNFRYVRANLDAVEANDNSGGFDFTIQGDSFDYGQVMVGTRYWLSKSWYLSLEVSKLVEVNDDIEFGDDLIYSLLLGWKI